MNVASTRYRVIMPAAGSGKRMVAAEKPKQYLELFGKTVIEWALSCFINDERCTGVVVALAKDDEYWSLLPSSKHPKIRTTTGGAERVDSVRNGLLLLQGAAALKAMAGEWILVHDAARPCLQRSDVDALLAAVSADEGLAGGLLATPVADTLKQSDDKQRVTHTVPRNHLWRAQTPQMFRFDVLHRALHSAHASRVTDESSAVELLGYQPRIVAGRADNIKITVTDDLRLAEHILRSGTS
ncbi:MAG: 2-C-methyl-D-erythritol 4-phosphate cytidylyltransferase [Steroidobacter sp.]